MQCPRCHSENDDDSKYCWSCGTSLHKAQAAKVACPYCKHENPSNANFCVACGRNLWHHAAATASASAGEKAASGAASSDRNAGSAVSGGATSANAATAAAASTAAPSKADRPNPFRGNGVAGPDMPFESAVKEPPRNNRYQMAALIVVLIALFGGILMWWVNQKEARMAEMALSKVVPPAKPAQAVDAPPPALEQAAQPYSTARLAPPTPPGARTTTHGGVEEVIDPPADLSETSSPTSRAAQRNTARRTVKPTEAAPAATAQSHVVEEVAAPQPVRPPEPKVATLREKIAACKQLSLFQKESCMWGLCSGKWGKDGCPSYER